MSTYVFMKVLERAPALYDSGMRLLLGGRLAGVHAALAEAVAAPGAELLDLGCGTAGVAIACARRGAHVCAIDADAGMLEVAQRRVAEAGLAQQVELCALGAAELEDRWPQARFDAVVSCLALSEMAPHEQRYALESARGRLRPGGRLAVADEVRAPGALGRLRQSLSRAPFAIVTRVLARDTSSPLEDLAALVRAAGFEVDEERRLAANFALVLAHRAQETT